MKTKPQLLKQIKRTVAIFITLLVLSGITAFPLQAELNLITKWLTENSSLGTFNLWIFEVNEAINYINLNYSFLAYGTDWLAFAHIIISIFFIGVYKDPIKNIWVTKTGIIACLLIFPVVIIAGYVRDIPLFWQLIDCSFGAIGLIPLILIHKNTQKLILNKN